MNAEKILVLAHDSTKRRTMERRSRLLHEVNLAEEILVERPSGAFNSVLAD